MHVPSVLHPRTFCHPANTHVPSSCTVASSLRPVLTFPRSYTHVPSVLYLRSLGPTRTFPLSCTHARSLCPSRTFPLSYAHVPPVLHARSFVLQARSLVLHSHTFPLSCPQVPPVLSCTHVCTFPLSCLHRRSLCPVLHARSRCPARTFQLTCTHIPTVHSLCPARTFPLSCKPVPSVLHARSLCPARTFPLSCKHVPSSRTHVHSRNLGPSLCSGLANVQQALRGYYDAIDREKM